MIGPRENFRIGAQALAFRATAENLVLAVQYLAFSSVEGEVAEFGCMTGRTAVALAAGLQWQRHQKDIHLFDSFEGLPKATAEADQNNFHVSSGIWGPGTCRGISPAQLRKKCARFLADERIHIYKGWFSETLPSLPAEVKFALVHIDCDLYQSAIDVLDYLFRTRRLSEGAIILFDDWDCNRASNDHGERRAWREVQQKFQVSFSDGGSYGCAGHKLIIHAYSSPDAGRS